MVHTNTQTRTRTQRERNGIQMEITLNICEELIFRLSTQCVYDAIHLTMTKKNIRYVFGLIAIQHSDAQFVCDVNCHGIRSSLHLSFSRPHKMHSERNIFTTQKSVESCYLFNIFFLDL